MSVSVIISAASAKHIVYHRKSCYYAKRIRPENKRGIPLKRIMATEGACPCKYCCGLYKDVRAHKRQMDLWSKNLQMEFTFVKNANRLYIRTDAGFWQIVPSREGITYYLYHSNNYSRNTETAAMMKWRFHRQGDVAETASLEDIVHYIHLHDEAKKTIADNYHKLPRSTKKQKQYYLQARKRDRREKLRRLDALFDQVEKIIGRENSINGGVFIGQAV